jgi:ADP-ribose pyrophosphatase YjhB (NUDIX family)
MRLTRWQSLRMAVYLFGVGLRRRMILGVRAALIEDDRVFLIRQTYMPGWQFPGGGVEPGETAEYAAARELFEETGYRPAGPMSLFGLYHNVNTATNRDHVALYVCRDFQMVHAFRPNLEIAEAGWFAFDALPEQTLPSTHRRIDEIFRGAPQHANW